MSRLNIPRYVLTYRFQLGARHPWQFRESEFDNLTDAREVIRRVKNDPNKLNLQMTLEKVQPIWTHRGSEVA